MAQPDQAQRLLVALEVLLDEFETYRRTGNRLHLAHAVRAVEEVRTDLHAMIKAPNAS